MRLVVFAEGMQEIGKDQRARIKAEMMPKKNLLKFLILKGLPLGEGNSERNSCLGIGFSNPTASGFNQADFYIFIVMKVTRSTLTGKQVSVPSLLQVHCAKIVIVLACFATRARMLWTERSWWEIGSLGERVVSKKSMRRAAGRVSISQAGAHREAVLGVS